MKIDSFTEALKSAGLDDKQIEEMTSFAKSNGVVETPAGVATDVADDGDVVGGEDGDVLDGIDTAMSIIEKSLAAKPADTADADTDASISRVQFVAMAKSLARQEEGIAMASKAAEERHESISGSILALAKSVSALTADNRNLRKGFGELQKKVDAPVAPRSGTGAGFVPAPGDNGIEKSAPGGGQDDLDAAFREGEDMIDKIMNRLQKSDLNGVQRRTLRTAISRLESGASVSTIKAFDGISGLLS